MQNGTPERVRGWMVRSAIVFSAYAILTAVILAPVAFGGKTLLSHDNLLGYYPLFVFKGLWNGALQGGFPLFADPQSQTFFPLAYFFPSSPAGFDLYAGTILVLGCFFAYLLAYDLTQSLIPSVIAGMIYGFSGSVLGQISMINVTGTSIWLPLVVLFFLRLARGSTKAGDSIGAVLVVFGCLFSGHTQFFIHIMFFCGILTAFYSYTDGTFHWDRLVRTGVAAFLGVLAASFVLIPFLELLPLTPRAGKIAMEGLTSYEMPLRQLIRLWYPYFYGAPGESDVIGTYAFAHSGFHNFHELNRAFGLLPFLLILPAWHSIRDKRFRIFLVFSFVFFFLFALGSQTPLIHVLMRIPVMNRFRGPARHFLEITLIASLFTAYGLRAVFQDVSRRSWRLAASIAAAAVLLLPPVWLAVDPAAHEVHTGTSFFSFTGSHGIAVQWILLALSLCCVLLLLVRGLNVRVRTTLVIVAGALAFADLNFGQRFTESYLNASGPESIARDESFPWRSLDAGSKTYFKTPNAYDPRQYYRFSRSAPNLTVPNLGIISGQPEYQYYNPLSLASWHKITLAGQFRPELFRLFGVRYEGGVYKTPFLPSTEPLLIGRCAELVIPFGIQPRRRRVFSFPDPLAGTVRIYSSVVCGEKDEAVSIRAVTDRGESVLHRLDLTRESGEFRGCNPDVPPVLTSRNGRDCINVFGRTLELPKGSRLRSIEIEEPERALLQIHGVSSRISSQEEFYNLPVLERLGSEKPFFVDQRFVMYENKDALPEAYLISSAVPAKGDNGLRLLLGGQVNLRTTAIVDGSEVPSSLKREGAVPPLSTVRVENKGDNEVSIHIESQGNALLILNHTFYPGWRAYLDGKEVKIYRVNLTVRGVEVPAGSHVVEFRFRPRSLWIGGAVSVAALLLLFWWIRKGLRRFDPARLRPSEDKSSV